MKHTKEEAIRAAYILIGDVTDDVVGKLPSD